MIEDINKICKSNHLSSYALDIYNIVGNVIGIERIVNFIKNEMLRYYTVNDFDYYECTTTHFQVSNLLLMEHRKEISKNVTKKIFDEMILTGNDPEYILLKNNLQQNNNESELLETVQSVITNNIDQVNQYKSGKKQVLGFFIGLVMKETKGKANPKLVNQLLIKKLS